MPCIPLPFARLGALVLLAGSIVVAAATAGERTESFDRDPGWEGRNNRATSPEPREIRQDFGFSPTGHAGGRRGELGGFLTPAAEPAYYAAKIPTRTFRDAMSASGTMACTGRQFHALVGFFNSETLGDWRTPNTIALRVYGRGDVFFAYVEYCTGRWRAGGDSPQAFGTNDPQTGRIALRPFASEGVPHEWSLRYDPDGHDGGGSITATIDDQTAVCHLDAGHKADGASFDRFGLMNVAKHADSGGELWLDDLRFDGRSESFDRDPTWDAMGNRRTYRTGEVRPRFDFGFSPTRFAGGASVGELGGLVFRGDGRSSRTLAYYADRLEPLSLDRPLRASGRISLRRGVSDSTTLFGFFLDESALAEEPSPSDSLPSPFLGLAVEGPSREGFLVYPTFRLPEADDPNVREGEPPHILPDGTSHLWTLEYRPAPPGGHGELSVSLDGVSSSVRLDLRADRPAPRLDRFGIVTTRVDGNGQRIFFDDLTYTASPD